MSVVLYRTGIVLSCVALCAAAFLAVAGAYSAYPPAISLDPFLAVGIFMLVVYFSIGLSVFFIHLYIGKFHRLLKKLYYLSCLCLIALFLTGFPLFDQPPIQALLLIPLSLCLGFITAKEAFCFKLVEGYLLAAAAPASIFFYSVGALPPRAACFVLAVIAAIYVIFVVRKVFLQPLHFDIGDKTAYQP